MTGHGPRETDTKPRGSARISVQRYALRKNDRQTSRCIPERRARILRDCCHDGHAFRIGP